MTTRTASCRCGQLQRDGAGDPVRVSVCHCLNCQKRSGSAFAAQARWPAGAVDDRGPVSDLRQGRGQRRHGDLSFLSRLRIGRLLRVGGKFDGAGGHSDRRIRRSLFLSRPIIRSTKAASTVGRDNRRRPSIRLRVSRPRHRDRRAGNCRPSAFQAAPETSRASAGRGEAAIAVDAVVVGDHRIDADRFAWRGDAGSMRFAAAIRRAASCSPRRSSVGSTPLSVPMPT